MGNGRLTTVLLLSALSLFIFGCGEKEEPVPAEETVSDQAQLQAETAEVVGLLPAGYIEGSVNTFVDLDSFPMLQELDGEDPLNLDNGAKGAVAAYTMVTKNTDSGEMRLARDHVFVIKYPDAEPAKPVAKVSGVNMDPHPTRKIVPARKAFEGYIEFFNRKREGYSIVGLFNEPIRILIHKEGKLDSIIYQHENYVFGAWNLQDASRREAMIKVLLKNIREATSSGN